MRAIPPTTQALIIVNALVYLLQLATGNLLICLLWAVAGV